MIFLCFIFKFTNINEFLRIIKNQTVHNLYILDLIVDFKSDLNSIGRAEDRSGVDPIDILRSLVRIQQV